MDRPGEDIDGLLSACPSRFALRVLLPFAVMNGLEPAQLRQLNAMLREARENKPLVRDGRVVWEALAIFALYTYFQVTDLADIADHLHLARPTVKRWISAIYGAFELDESDFPDRAARRQELRCKVVAEGYAKDTFWLRHIPLDLDGTGPSWKTFLQK